MVQIFIIISPSLLKDTSHCFKCVLARDYKTKTLVTSNVMDCRNKSIYIPYVICSSKRSFSFVLKFMVCACVVCVSIVGVVNV